MGMHCRTISPVEALRIAVETVRGPEPASAPLGSARGAVLAEAIEVAAAPRAAGFGRAVSARDGYALPPGFAGGRCRYRSPHLEPGESPAAIDDGVAEPDRALPIAKRLEAGDAVPPGCDRVLPVELARIVAQDVIAVEPADLPPPGAGIVAPGDTIVAAAGTEITARLQAFLLARGVREARVTPAWRVGVATVGRELVDVLALGDDDGSRVTGDVTGFWLPEVVRALGIVPAPLGVIDDDPQALIRVFLRAESQKLRTVIIAGGLGDGIGDRTLEALRTGSFRIFFERLALVPGGRLVLARGFGFDLFALAGAPLDAAVGFDVVVAPALLAARGLPPGRWDWSASPPELTGELTESSSTPPPGDLWSARAVRFPGAEAGEPAPGAAAFVPGLPGQRGWELFSPPAPRRFFVPCRGG